MSNVTSACFFGIFIARRGIVKQEGAFVFQALNLKAKMFDSATWFSINI
jgi:hypothetical protein